MEILILVVFFGIVVSLFFALFKLFRSDNSNSTELVKTLAIRVALSFILILVLVVAYKLNLISTNNVRF